MLAALCAVLCALLSSCGSSADATSAQDEKMSAHICKIYDPNGSPSQLEDYVKQQTGDSKNADKRWVAIVRKYCPEVLDTPASSSSSSETDGAGGAEGDPALQVAIDQYGPNVCQQLRAGRSVQDMVEVMIQTGQVDQLEAASLLGAIAARYCPEQAG